MKCCHNCPVAKGIEAGAYADAEWEAVPCSTCDAADSGGYAMEYDEGRQDNRDDEGYRGEHVDESNPTAAMLPVDVMQELVAGLLKLRPELRDVVALRYSKMSYPEIAERQGVSVAAVESRHRQAMAEWPALKALFPNKVAKQQTRQPHTGPKPRIEVVTWHVSGKSGANNRQMILEKRRQDPDRIKR